MPLILDHALGAGAGTRGISSYEYAAFLWNLYGQVTVTVDGAVYVWKDECDCVYDEATYGEEEEEEEEEEAVAAAGASEGGTGGRGSKSGGTTAARGGNQPGGQQQEASGGKQAAKGSKKGAGRGQGDSGGNDDGGDGGGSEGGGGGKASKGKKASGDSGAGGDKGGDASYRKKAQSKVKARQEEAASTRKVQAAVRGSKAKKEAEARKKAVATIQKGAKRRIAKKQKATEREAAGGSSEGERGVMQFWALRKGLPPGMQDLFDGLPEHMQLELSRLSPDELMAALARMQQREGTVATGFALGGGADLPAALSTPPPIPSSPLGRGSTTVGVTPTFSSSPSHAGKPLPGRDSFSAVLRPADGDSSSARMAVEYQEYAVDMQPGWGSGDAGGANRNDGQDRRGPGGTARHSADHGPSSQSVDERRGHKSRAVAQPPPRRISPTPIRIVDESRRLSARGRERLDRCYRLPKNIPPCGPGKWLGGGRARPHPPAMPYRRYDHESQTSSISEDLSPPASWHASPSPFLPKIGERLSLPSSGARMSDPAESSHAPVVDVDYLLAHSPRSGGEPSVSHLPSLPAPPRSHPRAGAKGRAKEAERVAATLREASVPWGGGNDSALDVALLRSSAEYVTLWPTPPCQPRPADVALWPASSRQPEQSMPSTHKAPPEPPARRHAHEGRQRPARVRVAGPTHEP